MLNELKSLSDSVAAAGIETPSWHKYMPRCPKGTTFLLFIGDNGVIHNMELLTDKERIASLRKFELAAGESFPVFNISPLYHRHLKKGEKHEALDGLTKSIATNEETEKRKILERISRIAEDFVSVWDQKERDRVCNCLVQAPRKLFEQAGCSEGDTQTPRAFCILRDRASQIDVDAFIDRIKELVTEETLKERSQAKALFSTFLFCTAKRVKKLSCVLELADWKALGLEYPANHPRVLRDINSLLLKQRSPNGFAAEADAYGGNPEGHDGAFDSADLPRLGKVSLWAMSSESPCQKRYHRGESNLFTVGQVTRQSMKDALEWLAKTERLGKTWENVTNASGYGAALLFAYPARLSAFPPEVAGLFGGDEQPKEQDKDGARFEALASRVVPAIRGILKEQPDAEINLFALGKVDKGRTKLLASRHYSAERLVKAASEWQEGCKNLPRVSLNLGTKNSPSWTEFLIPFPTEVVKCLNICWSREGERAEPTPSLDIGDGIDLLMTQAWENPPLLDRCIHLVAQHAAPLLLAMAHGDHRQDGSFRWGEDRSKGKSNGRFRKHGSLLPSILGLLLYKLSIGKETYMYSAPFLVGRMCSLADTLHREYCKHVRVGRGKEEKGSTSGAPTGMPRQLIGNAAMTVALGNPSDGLARLSERILIYQSWAQTAPANQTGLAKWALGRFGVTANELAERELCDTCSDADKAQMMLGYLARIEKEDNAGRETVSNSNESEDSQ